MLPFHEENIYRKLELLPNYFLKKFPRSVKRCPQRKHSFSLYDSLLYFFHHLSSTIHSTCYYFKMASQPIGEASCRGCCETYSFGELLVTAERVFPRMSFPIAALLIFTGSIITKKASFCTAYVQKKTLGMVLLIGKYCIS